MTALIVSAPVASFARSGRGQRAQLPASVALPRFSSLESISAGVDRAAGLMGGLDILVNCIGKNREQRLGEVTPGTFDEIYRTNLRSAMFLAQAAARHQDRGGRQVHLLSVRSQLGMRGYGYSAYCATKGAVELLVRALSLELSPLGIRANVIAPGNVLTPMNEHLRALPGYAERVSGDTPAGRFGEPEEIAAAVVFFASDAASFVHGASLLVDGGWIAR